MPRRIIEDASDHKVSLVDHPEFWQYLDRVDSVARLSTTDIERESLRNALKHVKVRLGSLDGAIVYSLIKAYVVDRFVDEYRWCERGFLHDAYSDRYVCPSTYFLLKQLHGVCNSSEYAEWSHKACADENTWCVPRSLQGMAWRIEETAKLVDDLYHRYPLSASDNGVGRLIAVTQTETLSTAWHADIVVNVLLEEALKTLWCIRYPGQDVRRCVGHNYYQAFGQLSDYHHRIVKVVATLPFFYMMFRGREDAQEVVNLTFEIMPSREWELSRYWWSCQPGQDRKADIKGKFLVAVALFIVAVRECVDRQVIPRTETESGSLTIIANTIDEYLRQNTDPSPSL